MPSDRQRLLGEALRSAEACEDLLHAAQAGSWDILKKGTLTLLMDFGAEFSPAFGRKFALEVRNAIGVSSEYLSLNESQAVAILKVSAAEATSQQLRLMGKAVTALLRERYAREVFLVFGRFCPTLIELPSAFQEIEQLSEYRFFAHEGACILAGQNPLADIDGTGSIDAACQEIKECIRQGDHYSAGKRIEIFFDRLSSGSQPEAYVKFLTAGIAQEMAQSGRTGDEPPLSDAIQRIYRAQSAQELRQLLLALVERETGRRNTAESVRRVIAHALAIIDVEYGRNMGLAEVADRLGLSPSYLSHLFAREVGKTFIRHLSLYRLERAAELLHRTVLPVAEVGRAVGYPSPSYFSLLFRRRYGVTPAQFRESN